jgi:hypothetical protein
MARSTIKDKEDVTKKEKKRVKGKKKKAAAMARSKDRGD